VTESDLSQTIAAIDLGSNSFHMVIGRAVGGEISLLDRLREGVRIASGLQDDGSLDEETAARALSCLERFGQRIREVPASRVRAVGTNTFRRARLMGEFMSQARKALGVKIEVLPGPEEARLIYLGVAHGLADDSGTRLVVDIGGGSTECVLGRRFEAFDMHSLEMGCVSYTRRFFSKGRLTEKAFESAELAANLELEPIKRRFRETGWNECAGSSGTINAIANILQQQWAEDGITAAGLKKLRKAMIRAGTTEALALNGLQSERAAVLAGGLAVLTSTFQSLRIKRMRPSKFALREGLLYDLVGRIRHEDVRDRTIESVSRRHLLDAEQAGRVERTALNLFDQVAKPWSLDREMGRELLGWAARVHEVGLSIAYSGYHRHGAYLLANSNLPGFSRDEQSVLAVLVRTHRRKLNRELFGELPPFHRELAFRLSCLLRLAVRLNRGRSSRGLAPVQLLAQAESLEVVFPEGWLDAHPLTRADVDEEVALQGQAGVTLVAR